MHSDLNFKPIIDSFVDQLSHLANFKALAYISMKLYCPTQTMTTSSTRERRRARDNLDDCDNPFSLIFLRCSVAKVILFT